MAYAIVRTGGKQYKVSPGDVVEVEHLAVQPNDKYSFSEVLLYVADGNTKVGNPVLSGIPVEGTILGHVRGDKIRVSKYKAKVRYRRVTGHRQELTRVKIETIGSVKQSSDSKPETKRVETKPTTKRSSTKNAPTKRTASTAQE